MAVAAVVEGRTVAQALQNGLEERPGPLARGGLGIGGQGPGQGEGLPLRGQAAVELLGELAVSLAQLLEVGGPQDGLGGALEEEQQQQHLGPPAGLGVQRGRMEHGRGREGVARPALLVEAPQLSQQAAQVAADLLGQRGLFLRHGRLVNRVGGEQVGQVGREEVAEGREPQHGPVQPGKVHERAELRGLGAGELGHHLREQHGQ